MNRVIFVLGAGIGFVLGARAGHERYRQIQRASRTVASSSPVQWSLAGAQRAFDAATPRVAATARQLGTESGQATRLIVGRVGEGTQHLAQTVVGNTRDLAERFTSQAEDLQSKVTLTAEDLRRRSDELRQYSTEQLEEMRTRIDEEIERSREATSDGFVRFGTAREDALETWEHDEDDDMVAPSAPTENNEESK